VKHDRSSEIFQRARRLIPGGVNSPVRAFRAVGMEPIVIERGAGAHVWDADGNQYIDYVGSWGPLLLGHCHPEVIDAVRAALDRGTSFGASTEQEVELAQLIRAAFPSMEKVRLVNSGTEATMSAIRVARGFTGRTIVVKFEGCYHGHVDALLVKAGSGVATLSLPDTAGIPEDVTRHTIALPFNDTDALRDAFQCRGGEAACAIVEPVVGNMGCVPPAPGFLEELRRLTQQAAAVLIFDEVMTGFRLDYGGVQRLTGIVPDMTTLGKVIGGGLPVGAYGGRADIMAQVAPEGPVYQAGTLSGNPLAVAAGIAMLKVLGRDPGLYTRLDRLTEQLTGRLLEEAGRAGVPVTLNRRGSMFTVFFTSRPVTDYASAKTSDTAAFSAFFRAMLEAGVYLPPSQFEAAFVSTVHTDADVEATVRASRGAFQAVAHK
jgi:glutamate-1-semialdehyde 2,1-aminomutase